MSKMVIQDATVKGYRQFVSAKGKACFLVELAFFGGSQSCFTDPATYGNLLGKFPKGTEVDAVVEGTWKEGGKFEVADEGGIELYPSGANAQSSLVSL
jgi:hypothetical protein